VVLGVAAVAEALLLLFIGWSRFGLATSDKALKMSYPEPTKARRKELLSIRKLLAK
jgi:hypothetical protein